MAFEFIREELTEARYIRTPRDTIGRSGDNLAEGFFEHLMVLQQMRFENPSWARKYAKDTLKFMNFTNVRTGATDLHNLASIMNNPGKFNGSTGGLPGRFDELGFKRYLRNVANDKFTPGQDRAFMMQMQKNLGIKGGLLGRARRIMSDYGRSSTGERQAVSQRMITTFRQDGRFRSDVFKPYSTSVKGLVPKEKSAISAVAKSVVTTAAVAAGAFYAGKQFGKKF